MFIFTRIGWENLLSNAVGQEHVLVRADEAGIGHFFHHLASREPRQPSGGLAEVLLLPFEFFWFGSKALDGMPISQPETR